MGTSSRMGQDKLAIIGDLPTLKQVVEQAGHGNRHTRRVALAKLRRHNKARAKYPRRPASVQQ